MAAAGEREREQRAAIRSAARGESEREPDISLINYNIASLAPTYCGRMLAARKCSHPLHSLSPPLFFSTLCPIVPSSTRDETHTRCTHILSEAYPHLHQVQHNTHMTKSVSLKGLMAIDPRTPASLSLSHSHNRPSLHHSPQTHTRTCSVLVARLFTLSHTSRTHPHSLLALPAPPR